MFAQELHQQTLSSISIVPVVSCEDKKNPEKLSGQTTLRLILYDGKTRGSAH